MHIEILTPTQLTVLDGLTPIPAVHEYGTRRTDRYHRLRALAYFADAEREPMPDLSMPFDWDEAKQFFTAEATRLLAAETGERP